ncbi:MAG: hypothetical protein QGH83_13990 [Candidatus Pacebacteria bacterium]|nr:hypothetical protein [Candidatus Paceibacterota bacterium]
MPALVTNKFRIHNAKQFVEAFDEVTATSGAAVSDASGLLNTNMYLFIGKTTAWSDDSAPPSPTDAVANTHYEHWRDMIAAKKISSSDVSHVIPRKNWTNNTSYFAYTDTEADLFSQDFFVMTDEFNVYKCLANNETTSGGAVGTTSTVKPTGTGTSLISTADGYKWKFLYQISASDALKFVTPNYIPVRTVRRANDYLANTNDSSPGQNQYDVETAVAATNGGNGAIEVVKISTRGSGYQGEVGTITGTPTTSTIKISGATAGFATNSIVNSDIYFTSGSQSGKGGTITAYNHGTTTLTFTPALSVAPAAGDGYAVGPKVVISGDGQGANVRATVNTTTGGINAISVISVGNNYSNASISIVANTTGLTISPTSLTPIVGPVGGHGSDAIKELGGYYILTNARLEYSESNNFTTNNDFRKVGIVAQPKYANGDVSTASVIDQATTIVLKTWNGTQYAADELVTGADSGCTGRVVDFTSNNTLRLTDIVPAGNSTTAGYNSIYGYFTTSEIIAANTINNELGAGSGASATANDAGSVTGGDLKRFSGDVLYVENRSPVTRANDQIEDVKLIIEF